MKLTALEKVLLKQIVAHLSDYPEYEGVWPPHALRLSWKRPPVKERRPWPIFWIDLELNLKIILIDDRGRPSYIIRSGTYGSVLAARKAEFNHVPYRCLGDGTYVPID